MSWANQRGERKVDFGKLIPVGFCCRNTVGLASCIYTDVLAGIAYTHTSDPDFTKIQVIKSWPRDAGNFKKAPTEINYPEIVSGAMGFNQGLGAVAVSSFSSMRKPQQLNTIAQG